MWKPVRSRMGRDPGTIPNGTTIPNGMFDGESEKEAM